MKRAGVIALVSGVVVGGVIIAALVPFLAAEASTPADALSLLAQPQDANDTALTQDQQFDLDPASIRYLGEDEGVTFWAGVGADETICVVIVVPDGTGGASCQPLTGFTRSGTVLGLYSGVGETNAIRVFLLPDTADLSGDVGPWHLVGTNLLWAVPGEVDDANPIEVPRSGGGSPFVLGP